jgi:penicillin-binding protein 2
MNNKESDAARSFTRRAFVLGALQGTVLTTLAGRLAWLQVAQGPKYAMLSDQNRINIKMIAPSRGEIVDRYGAPLAVNGQNFRVIIIPEQAEDLESSLSKLQKLITLSQTDIKRVIKKSQKLASFVPIEVKDNLSWEDVAKIEVNLPDLPGLAIEVGEARSYPHGQASAHIVGYVGAVSQAELTDDPVLTLPGFRIGKTGIEKAFDQELRGKAGTAEIEVNVVGREVRELSRNSGQPGKTIKLTIDNELQKFMQSRLGKERSASAIIMDVHTGAVYALASHPSFNPNLFTRGLPADKWEELLSDPGHPLNNKAVSGQYPPASTFKMVTALAALDAGLISAYTKTNCTGRYEFADDYFHCWKRWGHGQLDLVDAIAQSCDVFFYKVATDLGIDRISAMAKRMGLGHKLGFELIEERPGLMPDKDWKMGHFGKPWRSGESIVASIGQGYIQATPLQLAVMTSRLVNGGYAVNPWIVAYVGRRPGVDMAWSKVGVKKSHLDLIVRGMNKVVNHEKGTAYAARITQADMRMGGKTGTAQVRRITAQQRLEGVRNEDLPWKFRDNALFVGYAPYTSPRYACCVVVEHGGSGSSSAAPIARDLLLEAQRRKPAQSKIILGDPDSLNSMPQPLKKPLKTAGKS